MTHEARRREVERVARRIRRAAEAAPEGRHWYAEAREWAEEVAPEGADLFLGMLAATSARAGIRGNLRAAWRAYRLAALGRPTHWGAPYGVPFNARAVAAVARGEDPPGPKVGPFARALRGDPEAVAVDVWMARAAGYRDSPTARERAIVIDATRTAARRLGWTPAETQAAAWVATRRAAGWTASETYRSAWDALDASEPLRSLPLPQPRHVTGPLVAPGV